MANKTVVKEVTQKEVTEAEEVTGKIVLGDKVIPATKKNIKQVLKDNPKPKKDPLFERSNTTKRDSFIDALLEEFDLEKKMTNTASPNPPFNQEPVLFYKGRRIIQFAFSGKGWFSAYMNSPTGRVIQLVTNKTEQTKVHSFIKERISDLDTIIAKRETEKKVKTEVKKNSKPKSKKSKKENIPKNPEQERISLVKRMEENSKKNGGKNGISIPDRINVKSEWFTNLCEEHNFTFNTENRTIKQGK